MLNEQRIDANGVIRSKLEITIERLKYFEPPEGYFVAFSGGKDSQCIYHLCEMAGVKFDAHYHVTSVDPPELIYFIREHYPDVIWDFPRDENGKRITMWTLIPREGMPPTRFARFCCKSLKESCGTGRMTVTGVRWAESLWRKELQGTVVIRGKPKTTQQKAEEMGASYRIPDKGRRALVMNEDNDANRRLAEFCYRTQKTMLNPIVDWKDEEVWEFLNDIAKVPHCSLYDEGFKRLGCIGCPLAGSRGQQREFERFPQYKKLYMEAFDRLLQERARKGLKTGTWKNAEDVFNWWTGKGGAAAEQEDKRCD